jgi:hypothetical protein
MMDSPTNVKIVKELQRVGEKFIKLEQTNGITSA